MDAPRTSQMTATSAQICRDFDWTPGTVLESDDFEHHTLVRIRITAIGQEHVLAVAEEVDDIVRRREAIGVEKIWNLTCRDWTRAQ